MWWWVFGPIVAVAALLGGGWWWIVSDADWRRAQARAATLGIPSDERALALTYDAGSAADLMRAETMAKALVLPDHNDERVWREEFALLAMHQVEKLDALDAAVDRLPERPILATPDPWRPDRIDRHLIARILASRIVCCPRDEAVARIRRAVRFNVTSGVAWWGWIGGARMLINAVAERLPDLRGDEEAASALAAGLDRLAPLPRSDLERMRAHQAPLLRDATQPYRLFREYGMQLSDGLEYAPVAMVVVRWRREAQLDSYTDAIDLLAKHPDPRDWPRWFPLNPLARGFAEIQWSIRNLPRSAAGLLLRGRTVLAELRGEPWPSDWFDPAGKPMRRIERDGVLIGAYSVGTDGVDDGGIYRRDDCLAFGNAELAQPPAHAGDPLPRRPRPVRLPRYADRGYGDE